MNAGRMTRAREHESHENRARKDSVRPASKQSQEQEEFKNSDFQHEHVDPKQLPSQRPARADDSGRLRSRGRGLPVVMDAPPRPDATVVARSAVSACLGLVLASSVVSFSLSFASSKFWYNLPVAFVVVLATHTLGGVRFETRWDTRTKRFHASVSRRKHRGAGDTAGTTWDLFGKTGGLQHGTSANLDATEMDTDARGSHLDTASTSCATEMAQPQFPTNSLTKRETELHELLRRFETIETSSEKNSNSSLPRTSSPKSQTQSRNQSGFDPPTAQSPGLLGAWSKLRDKIVTEFITKLWYRQIAETDDEFPRNVSRVLDVAFAALAKRTRGVNLLELCLEQIPTILATHLEKFREAKRTLVTTDGVDGYVRSTPKETESAMAGVLLKDLGLFSENEATETETTSPLRVLEKHASRVLSKRCETICAALLCETGASTKTNPLLVPLARELLVGCLLRPLLGFFSPAWAHRGLNALLAAEDDIKAANGSKGGPSSGSESYEPKLECALEKPDDGTNGEPESPSSSVPDFEPARASAERDKNSPDETSNAAESLFGTRAGSSQTSVRVTEAHIAGKGASAYAVYTVRVRLIGDTGDTGAEKEWVVPRRFRNFQALHERLKVSAKNEEGVIPSIPSLPKKRFVLNSLDGGFLEARRSLLDAYLVELCGAEFEFSGVNDASNERVQTSSSSGWQKPLCVFLDQNTMTGVFAPDNSDKAHEKSSSVASFAAVAERGMKTISFGGSLRHAGDGHTPSGDAAHKKPPTGAKHARRKSGSSAVTTGAHSVPWNFSSMDLSTCDGLSASYPNIRNSDDASEADLKYDKSSVNMNGGVLQLFESVFHLHNKGVVRRTIVSVARQTLEFFVGSAVEELVANKTRALRTPGAVTRVVEWIDATLWPNGVWYKNEEVNFEGNGVSARGNDDSVPNTNQPGMSDTQRQRQSKRDQRQLEEDEQVRLKTRDALLASWSRGPLNNLVGDRNCTRAALDVLGAARSEILCMMVGLEVIQSTLDALFPESSGV